jgi:hypothetical protein
MVLILDVPDELNDDVDIIVFLLPWFPNSNSTPLGD